MAKEANEREEEEAKSKEAQVNRLISSIQANIPVLISVLFPRLYRLMWGNPDSTIKEIFARGMQNPDNQWFWNRESWDLNSGIQAKRSGIPLTTVPRTKNPECVNFCTFHSLGFFNYYTLYYHTQNLMIFITKQFFLRNYKTKLKKYLQEQHHTMKKFSKKTTTTIYHEKYCKAASNTF